MLIRLLTVVVIASWLFAERGSAQDQSADQTILHLVTSDTGQGETQSFSLATLQEMPTTTIETHTIWSEGQQTFEGVALADFVEHAGLGNVSFRAVALNDYAVEIPAQDAVKGGAVIAYSRNGNAMSVREKGPLWIVYPYDTETRYAGETYYARSIWQLSRLEVMEN